MPALFYFYIKRHQRQHSVREMYGTTTSRADVRMTNESALHASRGETLDVAGDPDVTSSNIIISASPSDTPTFSQASLQTSPGTGPGAERRPGPRAEPGGGRMWLIVLAGLLQCVSAYDVDVKKLDGLARARVEVE